MYSVSNRSPYIFVFFVLCLLGASSVHVEYDFKFAYYNMSGMVMKDIAGLLGRLVLVYIQ